MLYPDVLVCGHYLPTFGIFWVLTTSSFLVEASHKHSIADICLLENPWGAFFGLGALLGMDYGARKGIEIVVSWMSDHWHEVNHDLVLGFAFLMVFYFGPYYKAFLVALFLLFPKNSPKQTKAPFLKEKNVFMQEANCFNPTLAS